MVEEKVRHETSAVATGAAIRLFDSGSEGIQIDFDLPGPLPDTSQAAITGMLWMTTEKVQKRSKATLARVGCDPEDPKFKTDDQLLAAIVGKAFDLVCEIEPANDYHARDKWVVRYINAPAKEAEPGSANLLSRLRGRQVVQPNTPLLSTDDESDVPF